MAATSIRSKIENTLAKGKIRVRHDTVRKAIEQNEYESIQCNYHYTDDYLQDQADNWGEGSAGKDELLSTFRLIKPMCWIDSKQASNKKEYYTITISFHSGLSYTMFVPVEA